MTDDDRSTVVLPRRPYSVPLPGGGALTLGARTLVMGILNVTPDSFADGGRHLEAARAVDVALQMEADGADLIDIGGESTRPGAAAVGAGEERGRVLPVLRALTRQTRLPISIDTYKADVARAAIGEGAAIINDVSSLQYDPSLAGVVARHGAALILMHNRGRSRDMYLEATYQDVAAEVAAELGAAMRSAVDAGVDRERILLDPGIGFAKRAGHSYAALAGLEALAGLDRPLLVGPSRKSFLQAALGERPPDDREWGTAAAVAGAVLLGAHIVRVHGVRAMADVVRVADRIRDGRKP